MIAQELYRTVATRQHLLEDFVRATEGMSWNQMAQLMQSAPPDMRSSQAQPPPALNYIAQQPANNALVKMKPSTALSEAIARAERVGDSMNLLTSTTPSRLPSTTSRLPSMTSALPLNQQGDGGQYVGSSGARYRYDLSKPYDALMYSVDPGAQVNDSVNPSVMIDRGLGQFGGGATR